MKKETENWIVRCKHTGCYFGPFHDSFDADKWIDEWLKANWSAPFGRDNFDIVWLSSPEF